jgi:hypothetical protein
VANVLIVREICSKPKVRVLNGLFIGEEKREREGERGRGRGREGEGGRETYGKWVQ